MKTTRHTIKALMSVCSILWIVGSLLFFNGEAEARRRHGGASNRSTSSQPREAGTVAISPEGQALLKQVPQNPYLETSDPPKQPQEAVWQDDGNQAAVVRGQVFRFEDADGVVHYTNTPCDPRYGRSAGDRRCGGTR